MSELRDAVLQTLKDCDDNVADTAERIYSGPKKIALYVIQIGLEAIKSKYRRARRQTLKSEIRPQFVHKPGGVTGSVVFTKKTKQRIVALHNRIFSEWAIGDMALGMMTKEQLLEQAERERASAKGSLRNAYFYEALAQPLMPGALCGEHWSRDDAVELKKTIWKETEASTAKLQT